MKAPIYKKHIRLKEEPKEDKINGLKIWYRGFCEEWERPILTTDVIAGQARYELPPKAWGNVYHFELS